ncbi:hypothetical protein ABZ896_13470 [Streptomyces sp. NPDC047072]|uniref:hypothetical protein n=1 Tax=Streptomyces sp. NPDC047072 TaxID=3154809 RepID=UPI0033FAEA07
MAVQIEFVDQTRATAQFVDSRVSKTEAHSYFYELLPHGAVAVYKVVQPTTKRGDPTGEAVSGEIVVYGPGTWFAAYGTRFAR